MKERIVAVLRWIAVLPAAFFGAALAPFILKWAWRWGWDSNTGDEIQGSIDFGGHWILGPLYSVFLGIFVMYGFVTAGSLTAPNHRRETAFSLAGMISLLLGALWCFAVYVAFKSDEVSQTGATIRAVLSWVPGTVAAFAFASETRNEPDP